MSSLKASTEIPYPPSKGKYKWCFKLPATFAGLSSYHSQLFFLGQIQVSIKVFQMQDKCFSSSSMSVNQEVKEMLFFEYPKRLELPGKNKFILIMLDCFTPEWWQVFGYHWPVWNVLLISTSNNKQPECWIPDGIETELIQTHQRGKYVIHKKWNPCPIIVWISPIISPQSSNLYFVDWSILTYRLRCADAQAIQQ